MKSFKILALAGCGLAVSIAVAQQAAQSGSPPYSQQFPGPLGTAVFGRVVAGEFTGDLSLDCVVMDGTQPRLAVSPDVHDTGIATNFSAKDIAVLPEVLPGKDLLVSVGDTGLVLHERDYAASSWIDTVVRGANTPWEAGRFVRCGDLDGAGGLDLVGVSGSGAEVLIEYGDGNGGFTSGTSISAYGGTIYGLELLDFAAAGDIPGTVEIAILTSGYGVEVYEIDGTYRGSMPWSGAPLKVVPISSGPGLTQRLAGVAHVGANDWVSILDVNGTEGPYNLGPLGVVSLAAADADADGDDELFLSINTATHFVMLENLAPALPTFQVSAAQTFPHGYQGRDPAFNTTGLAPGDFDGDGALDMLAPGQGTIGPVAFTHSSLDVVQVGSGDPQAYRAGIEMVQHHQGSEQSVWIYLEDPAQTLVPTSGETLGLRVQVWRSSDLGVPVEQGGYDDVTLPLPVTEPYVLPLPAGYDIHASTDLFFLVVRQVITVNGQVVDQAPAMTGIFTGEVNWDAVSNLPETTDAIDTNSQPPDSGGVGRGPTVGGNESGEQPNNG